MKKYEIVATSKFKKDLKAILKRNLKVDLLDEVVTMLAQGEALPGKYKDHTLTGDWTGHRECHIAPDWLLVYKMHENLLVLSLVRTGSHSNLF